MAEVRNDQNNNSGQNQNQNQNQGGSQDQQARFNEQNPNADPNWQPATTGAVIDPEHDGRLKENREAGVTKGTTEHSSKAPVVGKDDSGSVNNQWTGEDDNQNGNRDGNNDQNGNNNNS